MDVFYFSDRRWLVNAETLRNCDAVEHRIVLDGESLLQKISTCSEIWWTYVLLSESVMAQPLDNFGKLSIIRTSLGVTWLQSVQHWACHCLGNWYIWIDGAARLSAFVSEMPVLVICTALRGATDVFSPSNDNETKAVVCETTSPCSATSACFPAVMLPCMQLYARQWWNTTGFRPFMVLIRYLICYKRSTHSASCHPCCNMFGQTLTQCICAQLVSAHCSRIDIIFAL